MMYYRIYGKAVFPEGIAPGEDKGLSNMITASRNGEGEPVLRGIVEDSAELLWLVCCALLLLI